MVGPGPMWWIIVGLLVGVAALAVWVGSGREYWWVVQIHSEEGPVIYCQAAWGDAALEGYGVHRVWGPYESEAQAEVRALEENRRAERREIERLRASWHRCPTRRS